MDRHDALLSSYESEDYIALLFLEDTDELADSDFESQYRIDLKARNKTGKDRTKRFDAKDDRDAKRKFRQLCAIVAQVDLGGAEDMRIEDIQEPRASNAGLANYGRF